MQTPSFKGQKALQTQSSDFNTTAFHIRQEISKLDTTTVVKIIAVNVEARISPVGRVDVQPIVDQMDGNGKSVPHGIIYNVPYMRMQGGKNALIIDPQVDDIGICCFANRDITRVKETKTSSLPGSKRMMSMSDGLYIGGVLNGAPERYIIIEDDGIEIEGKALVHIHAEKVTIDSDTNIEATAGASVLVNCVDATVNATASATVTAPVLSVNSDTITFTGATSISLVSALINLTAPIITTTGTLTALDFATTASGVAIASINAHAHKNGSYAAGGDPVTGVSGASNG